MCFAEIEMDDEADHVIMSARWSAGLAVMEILARHPAGMTLTEMAEEAGPDPRRRAPLPADAGRHRLCARRPAGVSRCRRACSPLPAPGSAAPRCGPSPSRICASGGSS